jgi:hypothetical protein
MLFQKTLQVYCEGHTKHTNTLRRHNAVFWLVNFIGSFRRFTYNVGDFARKTEENRHKMSRVKWRRCDSPENGIIIITPSSGMLRLVALVRTEVSEEFRASFIRVTRIGELGTMLAVTSDRRTTLRSVLRLLVTASVLLIHRFLSPWKSRS